LTGQSLLEILQLLRQMNAAATTVDAGTRVILQHARYNDIFSSVPTPETAIQQTWAVAATE
jgi:hypothetical protein